MKWLLFLSLLPVLLACELTDKNKQLEKATQKLEQAGDKVREKLSDESKDLSQKANEAKKTLDEMRNVAIIESEKLSSLLPDNLPGLDRTHINDHQNTQLGLNVSQAEAEYSDGDEAKININVIDLGSLQAITAILKLPWLDKEIDNKQMSGFERTREVRGHRGYEKYNTENRKGEIHIVINDRVVLSVTGKNVGHRELDRALGRVDLRQLEQLAD